MNVQKVNEFTQYTNLTAPKTASQETNKKSSTQAADNTDKIITESKYTAAYSPAYTKNSSKSADITEKGNAAFDASKSVLYMKNQAMKSYVNETLSGKNTTGADSQYKALFGNNPIISGALAAAEKTSEKHDDYWGIEATAERIFTFAKSLAGEDEAMLNKMEEAFYKGFNQALGAKKGKLPDISYQTKDRVVEMFKEYRKELSDKKNGVTPAESEEAASKTAATSTTYSGGKKISYIGNEKYGASYTNNVNKTDTE